MFGEPGNKSTPSPYQQRALTQNARLQVAERTVHRLAALVPEEHLNGVYQRCNQNNVSLFMKETIPTVDKVNEECEAEERAIRTHNTNLQTCRRPGHR